MPDRLPAIVYHPGVYLRDELKARGWSQAEFASIIGRPVQLVNQICNEKRGISARTAHELAAGLGTSPEFWMKLDTAYKLWKLEQKDAK